MQITRLTTPPSRQRPHKHANHGLHSVTPSIFLGRLRYQLLFGVLISTIFPPAAYFAEKLPRIWFEVYLSSTCAGTFAAFCIALYLFRRVITFPGVGIVGYVLPAVTAGYGIIVAVYFGLRLDYSSIILAVSFVSTATFLFVVSVYLRNRRGQRIYLIPSASTEAIPNVPNVEWVAMCEPKSPQDPRAVFVADLRADLGEQWERLIADMAVAGHPVYHVKQVQESLTGRVEIEHLSENSFGSLIPNLGYRKIKRVLDLALSLLILPILVVPGLIVGVLIKLDSIGPIFFKQRRRGYRGKIFDVIKFRTMIHGADEQGGDRERAITLSGDKRITRLGRFLRRTRIDELPQIWNIIKGEMSWIGPRPEALSLSEWYTTELPFYSYRHIVRPGITGWAQVNQGHVAALDDVYEKLHFDFYYIKNFSAWLDILIVGKTVSIVLSGNGAK